MGRPRTINPTIAGTFSMSIMRIARETVSRMPVSSSRAACCETVGKAAVAIETPKSPIGKYMIRKA